MISLIFWAGMLTGAVLLLLWLFIQLDFLWLFIPPSDRWYD